MRKFKLKTMHVHASTKNYNYQYVVLFIFIQIIAAISFSKHMMELVYVKITMCTELLLKYISLNLYSYMYLRQSSSILQSCIKIFLNL